MKHGADLNSLIKVKKSKQRLHGYIKSIKLSPSVFCGVRFALSDFFIYWCVGTFRNIVWRSYETIEIIIIFSVFDSLKNKLWIRYRYPVKIAFFGQVVISTFYIMFRFRPQIEILNFSSLELFPFTNKYFKCPNFEYKP